MSPRPKRALTAMVDALANYPAGAQIGFQSDTAHVSVRVKLAGPVRI
jgi:hypothetical protein